jgi:hypothetical protein
MTPVKHTMKIRRLICYFVAFATMVSWFGKTKPMAMMLMASEDTNATTPVNMTGGKVPAKSPPEGKADRMLGALATYNDVPIIFYGRLEDQFSNAVASAAVNFSVQVYSGTEATANRGQVMTDSHGHFAISGYKGESLGLVPSKAGYALATTGTFFRYSQLDDQHYVPDPINPTVIKMWKLQGAEPLVSINQHYKVLYTDAPMNFDLLAGKMVQSGGDIKLTVIRAPGVLSARNRLGWSLRVEAVEGGLMDSNGQDSVTYAAPAKGYQPSMVFTFSTNAPYKWSGAFNTGIFVQSRNGQMYSKLGLSFRINTEPDGLVYITFGGVANANGTRNWEGDPNICKPQ